MTAGAIVKVVGSQEARLGLIRRRNIIVEDVGRLLSLYDALKVCRHCDIKEAISCVAHPEACGQG